MTLAIDRRLLSQVWFHGEALYPGEGAGFLLGIGDSQRRTVKAILPIKNALQAESRKHRYLNEPRDMLVAEEEAERLRFDVAGVFHSHPDHPPQASEFDREWAMPYYSYLITSVHRGRAAESRSWRLTDDRSKMNEEPLEIRLLAEVVEES